MLGIDTTRTPMPSSASFFAAATASATSEPVAMTIAASVAVSSHQHVSAALDRRSNAASARGLRFRLLTSQHERGGTVSARNRRAPRDCRFDRVARTPHRQIRRGAQIRQLFDRLVRWTVFAERHGIVRVHEDVVHAHQRRQAHGVARVFHEDQERAGIRNESAVQRNAVGDARSSRIRARRSARSCRRSRA